MLGKLRKARWETAAYLLFLAFYIWMAAQIPYSYDDWMWGSPAGIQDWLHAISNSRYVGNFFEILMSRSEILKTVIMGGATFLIPLLITDIAARNTALQGSGRRLICFVACNVLMLSVASQIWAQTYGWVAGFANFTLSAVFMLLCLREFLRVFDGEPDGDKPSWVKTVVLFFVALCGQLFIENIAVLMVAVALAACAVQYIRTKKLRRDLIAMTLGILIGVVIMFSSSIYVSLLTTGEAVGGYRKLPVLSEGSLFGMVYTCIRQAMILFVWVWRYHWAMAAVILLLMSILLLQCRNPKFAKLRWPAVVMNGLLAVYFIANDIYEYVLPVVFVTAFDIVFCLGIIGEAFMVFYHRRDIFWKLIAVWICVVAVVVPLAVTSENGYRVFVTSHILLILAAAILLCGVLKEERKWLQRAFAVCCAAATVVSLLYYGNIYAQIGRHKALREKIIADGIRENAATICLPKYPHQGYLWLTDPIPEEGWATEEFKAFHGIDPDVTLVIR